MRGRPLVTLTAMCIAQVMILLDATIVQVALPTIQRELGVKPANLAWIVNAYVLALAALLLTGGALGDRYGRRRVFLAGLGLFTLGSAACALSGDDPQLVAARVVQGVGAAAMAPLTLSILTHAYPGPSSGRAIAIWAAVGSVGFGLGPVVGGFLVEHVDWSAIFWVNVPLGAICAGLCAAGVEESRDPAAQALDPLGAVLAGACLFTLVFALLESGSTPWLAAPTGGVAAVSVMFAVLFALWERRAPAPMTPPALLRERTLVAALAVTLLANLAIGGLLFLGTLLLQNVRGSSPFVAGSAWVPMSTAFAVVAVAVPRLTARVGAARALTAGLVVTAVGMAGVAVTARASYGLLILFFVLIGVGFGVITPTVTTAGLAALDPGRSGVAAGMVNTARQVGLALGIAALVAVSTGVATRRYDPPPDLRTAAATGAWREAAAQVGEGDALRLEDAFVDGLRVALGVAAAGLAVAAAIAHTGLMPRRA